jgi:hypothetical protein
MALANDDDDEMLWLARYYFFSDDDEESLNSGSAAVMILSSHLFPPGSVRAYDRQRLFWSSYVEKLTFENLFARTFRMSLPSFEKLVLLLASQLDLEVNWSNGSAPILPELVLAIGLRALAGGSYLDVKDVYNVSIASFYRTRNKVVDAINNCQELQFHFPATAAEAHLQASKFEQLSQDRVMKGCVGARDGCLIKIVQPNQNEVINVRKYYSGHYEDYGLNIQAVANHRCQFLFFSVAAAGGTADSAAYRKTSLPSLVDGLPMNRYIVADAAYPVSEKLLVPFTGSQRNNLNNDTFNFFLSQLRIRVEQAFGLLTNKWRILRTPMANSINRNSLIITACSLLHNYVINEDWVLDETNVIVAPELASELNEIEPMPGAANGAGHLATLQPYEQLPGSSVLRESIVAYIDSAGLRRPAHNNDRNRERALELEGLM